MTSRLGGATTERGGRRKRIFTVTALDSRTLLDIQQLRKELWELVPAKMIQLSGL